MTVSQILLMLKNLLYALSGVAILLSITQMRIPPLNLILRQVSTIMAKEVTVEPYSMAFVTAPNKDVAKTLAGGLGKYFSIPQQFLFFEIDNLALTVYLADCQVILTKNSFFSSIIACNYLRPIYVPTYVSTCALKSCQIFRSVSKCLVGMISTSIF